MLADGADAFRHPDGKATGVRKPSARPLQMQQRTWIRGKAVLSIKGTFQNGVALPLDAVEGREGQTVIITFLDESSLDLPPPDATTWDSLEQLIDTHAVETGLGDLAHQHDHYVHGKPRQP